MVSRASERSVGVPDVEEKWGDAATHRHRGRNSPLTFWPLFADVSKKDIQEVIQKYLCRENMVVGIMYEKGLNQKKIKEICETFI